MRDLYSAHLLRPRLPESHKEIHRVDLHRRAGRKQREEAHIKERTNKRKEQRNKIQTKVRNIKIDGAEIH